MRLKYPGGEISPCRGSTSLRADIPQRCDTQQYSPEDLQLNLERIARVIRNFSDIIATIDFVSAHKTVFSL